MSSTFRFHAKNVFLTYPDSGELTKEQLRDFLVDRRGARWFHIGLESHADGRPHLHAYAGWDHKLDTRDARYFDVGNKHPNIAAPHSPRSVREYVGKGGDVLSNCSGPAFESSDGPASKWGSLLAEPNRESFMAGVARLDPRAFVLQHERVEYFCEKYFGREQPSYSGRGRDAFREPEELSRWVLEHWMV